MSITDGLREWSKNWSETNRSLDEIADRIDEAHEVEIEAARLEENTEVWAAVERTHIALPKDKNGFPIKTGDLNYAYDSPPVIIGLGIREDIIGDKIPTVFYGDCTYDFADSVVTVKPDTQEKIDADAKEVCCAYWGLAGAACVKCEYRDNSAIFSILRRQRELDGK